jgi:hypothetical protein
MNSNRKTNRVELINGLFNGQTVKPNMNTWHARISAAVKASKEGKPDKAGKPKAGKSNKLPDDAFIEPAVFNGWAYDNFSDDLPPPSQAMPRSAHVLPRRDFVLPGEAPATVGKVVVVTPPPKEASNEELIEQIRTLQIKNGRLEQELAGVKGELAQFKNQRAKSSEAGRKGGRGNEN